MKKKYKFLITGFVGILGFFVLPSYLKAFTFFIPLFLISYILRADSQYFNIFIFISGLFIYFLLPTDLISFNLTTALDGGNGSLMNTNTIISYVNTIVNIISVVFFIIVPIFVFVISLYAIVKGNVGEGLSKLFMAFSIMAFVIGFSLIAKFLELELFGVAGWIIDFYVVIIEFCLSLPLFFYALIDAIVTVASVGTVSLPDLPKIDTYLNLDFDMFVNQFNTLSYTNQVYLVHDALPLFVSILSFILALIFAKNDWEVYIMRKIDKYNLNVDFKEKRKYLSKINIKLVIYLIFLFTAALGLFLSYNNLYKTAQIQIEFSTFGYFSIYLIISSGSLFLLIINPKNLFRYTDSNLGNTIFGILVGEFGLFLIVQMFNTYNKTFDVLSLDIVGTSFAYIINQFLFVAPTESLLFHILIPSLVIGLLYRYTEREMERQDTEELEKKINAIESDIATKQAMIEYYITTRERKRLAEEEATLNDLIQKLKELKAQERKAKTTEDSLYGRYTYIILLFAFAIILPNFVFGFYHWFNSNVDFFVFWTSGLGVLYLISGCWFSFIAMRYGWLACLSTHAIHNSLTIIIILLYSGLI